MIEKAKSRPKTRLDKGIMLLLNNTWQGWQLEDRTLSQQKLIESISNMREVLD